MDRRDVTGSHARRVSMINRLVIIASGAVLALGGCNKHDDTNVAAGDNVVIDNGLMADNGMAANDMAASPLTAQGFVNAAAASDKFEIETSKLAAANASSAAVKKFATQMIAAHTASTAKLKA